MSTTVAILNDLLSLHGTSLPRYLANAKPYGGDEKTLKVIGNIMMDHGRMVDRIGKVIQRHGGPVLGCDFPMVFTDMHDLSMDYILNEVCTRQRSEVSAIEKICDELRLVPDALAIAQESLGAAKGHVEQLDELMSGAAT